jgi:transmembrane sensor
MLGRRQSAIEAKAAEWIIRLGEGPLRDEQRRTLDQWLAECPAHASAFDRARSTWADLGALQAVPGALLDDVAPPRHRSSVGYAGWYQPVRVTMRRAAAVVALLAVGTGFAAFWFGNPLLILEADYRTAPGESRSVTLADGSNVQLATNSALAVHFDRQERRITVLSGEAYFTIAPMQGTETRPFVVEAANGTAKALGTQFMVDHEGDETQVVVAEHQVQVSATTPGRSEASSVVLSPNQAVHYDRVFGIGAVTQTDLDQATAWRRGRLVFDKVSLADVIAQLNRFRRGRIVIADADLARRSVSGVFEIADLNAALATIARELGLRTAALPPFVTVLY